MKGKYFYYTRKKASKTTLLTLTHKTPNAAIFSLTITQPHIHTHTKPKTKPHTHSHIHTRNIIETEVST